MHSVEFFQGRDDGLVAREVWRDTEGGGGFFLFADPTVQNMAAFHTNQSALGGGLSFLPPAHRADFSGGLQRRACHRRGWDRSGKYHRGGAKIKAEG